MKRVKLLELGKKGVDYDFVVPKGTMTADLEKALAYSIIEISKYRKIGTSTFLAEISQWVRQLEEVR